jgi:hypothetical protein
LGHLEYLWLFGNFSRFGILYQEKSGSRASNNFPTFGSFFNLGRLKKKHVQLKTETNNIINLVLE